MGPERDAKIDPAMGSAVDQGRRYWPVIAAGGFCVAMVGLLGPFVTPGLRRNSVPYIPATHDQVRDALSLARTALTHLSKKPSEANVLDLGSGDGRLVLKAVEELGVRGRGIELNRWLVLYSRLSALRGGLGSKATFSAGNLWKVNFGDPDVVFLFLGSEMMPDIERLLEGSLKKHSAVITNRFPLPSWSAKQRLGLATLYLSAEQGNVRQGISSRP